MLNLMALQQHRILLSKVKAIWLGETITIKCLYNKDAEEYAHVPGDRVRHLRPEAIYNDNSGVHSFTKLKEKASIEVGVRLLHPSLLLQRKHVILDMF